MFRPLYLRRALSVQSFFLLAAVIVSRNDAHLIGAVAQWLYVLEGKRDWEQHHPPTAH